ncbi:MAG: DUF1295 domain-containing protein [Saprospiraceae bacterium]
MKNQQVIKSLIIAPIIAALVALAGSQTGQSYQGLPIFAIGVGLAFLINWLVFIPANIFQTEKFFDLTGSLTYILVTVIAFKLSDNIDNRSMLLAGLVIIWAVRLGSFLFNRILQDGKDDRFDTIKPNFLRFLNVWTLQAIWVTLTASAATIGITSTARKELGVFAMVGLVVWIIGFLLEVVADYQKRQFRRNPANKGKFIQSGLWAKSRHPNYFGEIMLWTGVFIIAIPVLQGWQWVALLSPLFVYLLLTKISGVPGLEAKANKKWGGQADYEAYKANTPILIPKL